MPPPDVVVVGDVMVDVAVAAPALARGGDVHGAIRFRTGGAGANAAVWAARAGASVRLHGRVGDDVPGAIVRGALLERGVDPALTVDPDASTGTLLVVTEPGERSMVSDSGANDRLSSDDLPAAIDARCVLVSGYLLLRPGSHYAARAALDRSRARRVAVDAASWPLLEAFGPERFLETAAPANLVVANDREAEALCGARREEAVRRLADRFGAAVVKLGPHGAAVAEGGEVAVVGSPRAEPVDVTGAGDAFDGTLLASLAAGAPLPEAAERAA
ncbi:MAG TPA: PfkB family carbohydrate kinase, partial [Actinomycetota bacterium]|nr:PfkB family carbohydrate kinase [Actinomycetota bacterium]